MDSAGFFDDPLGGLDDETWDRLARDRFYSSAFWLRLCAMEGGGASGGVHVDLPGGGRAAVPVIAVGEDPHPNCRWGDLLAARGLPSPPETGMLVGQRRGYLAHLLTDATDTTGRTDAAGRVLEAVRSARPPVGEDGGGRVALYLTTPDVLAFRAAGVRPLPVLLATDAWITVPAGGRESWLKTLSPHRARRVRAEIRRFGEAGYRVWRLPLEEAYADVARLAVNVERRYGRAAEEPRYAAAFRAQGELAGDRAQVLLCGPPGEPAVACCLFYRDRGEDGDTLYLRAVGFDYDRLRGAAEYFNLTYHLPAGLPGVRRLHAGIETPDGKALRGARLDPLWLLDLTRDSPLTGCEDRILAHNRDFRTRLAEGSPAVAAALESESWRVPF